MKLTSTLLFILIACTCSIAQDLIVISGQLTNLKTEKGVPYANIGIPERGIGTTSNDDGRFMFKVPKYYENSTLIVSVIGYETYKKPLKDIKGPLTIKLKPTIYNLDEVHIVDESAVENIIRKAVNRIPNNYPTYPTTVLGFYRESRTDSFDKYVYLAEGVLNIHKNSYKSRKEGMVGLVEGRKMNLKNPLDTIVQGGFTSGHMAAHRFDFVKNREDFINEDYFPAYKYWIENITTYNGREVYVIAFDKDPDAENLKRKKIKATSFFNRLLGGSKSEVLDARLRGKVYIEKETYAFIRAEFEVTEKGLRQYSDYPLYSGVWTFNTYVVNYQKVDGKWYFSDALREGGRKSGGIYSNEIKITEVETAEGKPIPYLERIGREAEFVDMTGHYDENFWNAYNTVPMSEKLSESMQQFKTDQKARQVFSPKKMEEIQALRDSVTIARRIAQAEKEAKENEEAFDPSTITFGEPGLKKKRRRKIRFESNLGIGTHLIHTPETQMGISYLNQDASTPLISTNNTISSRDFEIIYSTGLNIVFNKWWFLRFESARDFGRTIYRESASGLGLRFNLSRQRPVFLKFSAQHSRIRYARLLGITDNNEGRFTLGNKNFNSNRVRIFYGSRSRNLKLSADLTVEMSRHREIYIRSSFYLPYMQNQEAHFREASIFFKKRQRIPVGNDRLEVTSNDQPFSGALTSGSTVQFTIGYVFK